MESICEPSSSNASDLTFVETERGGLLLMRGGHQYHKRRINKNGTTVWCCVKRQSLKCTGIAITKDNLTVSEKPHSCTPTFSGNMVKEAVFKCRQRATSESDSMQKIYEEEILALENQGLGLVETIPKFTSIKHGLYNARKRSLGIKKIRFDNITDIQIPEMYNNFILADYSFEQNRIIIFASDAAKTMLGKVKNVLSDGTFKICPKPFMQLYTIHGDIGSTETSSNVVPLVYALLMNKRQNTYELLLHLIKSQIPDWCPETFKMDFEIAAMKAVENVFPNCKVNGCYFHFKKCLYKKAKYLKIEKCKLYKTHVALLCALSLLPHHLISDGYLYIVEDSPNINSIVKFNDYFVCNWLENDFISNKWSFFNEKLRTTNHLEGWHSKINRQISGHRHPTFLKFLEIIFKDAGQCKLKLKQIAKGFHISQKTTSQTEFDLKINNVVKDHLNGRISLGHCLEKICNLTR